MIKSNKAITLIALIITIIVLLVLAAVTINMVLGENGLINKAKTSVGKYENAQEKENTALERYEAETNSYINGNRDYETEINTLKKRIAELENEKSHSTDERIIGKWIDGKPLYQKTFVFTSMSITSIQTNFGDLTGLDIDYGDVVEVNFNDNNYFVGEGDIKVWIRKPNNNFGALSLAIDRVGTLYFTINYTKTTDPVPTT